MKGGYLKTKDLIDNDNITKLKIRV
jgi:hypothetical protein